MKMNLISGIAWNCFRFCAVYNVFEFMMLEIEFVQNEIVSINLLEQEHTHSRQVHRIPTKNDSPGKRGEKKY